MPKLFHENGRSISVPAETAEFYLGLGWSESKPGLDAPVVEPAPVLEPAPVVEAADDASTESESTEVATPEAEPAVEPATAEPETAPAAAEPKPRARRTRK